MADEIKEQLDNLENRLIQARQYLRLDQKRQELQDLDALFNQAGFWDSNPQAQELSRQAAELRNQIADYEQAVGLMDDANTAYELSQFSDGADTENLSQTDQSMAVEAQQLIAKLNSTLDDIELSSWFDGQYDQGSAIISINPGQGGLEAQDWADMLFKMYLRYAQRHKWKVEVLDAPAGEVIGIDSATFIVTGRNAYGMLRAEQGTHRLVRISPTDEKKRRQTTFAGVEVMPVLPDDIQIDLPEKDIRIDVYRSSGPGGQSVNTTDSAVRITHLPTGTVVTCQNQKSQLQNKEAALKILRSRLYEQEQTKRNAEVAELRGEKTEASWGNQIRNYVLYPYQLVKDVRSGAETGNVSAVLEEGDLDPFIVAYHRWRVGEAAK